MLLSQILAFTKHAKRVIKNNKFRSSTPTWNEKFELSDR